MGIAMKRFLKNTLVLLLFVLVGCRAMAQKFATHSVKRGETLESIAKQYRVTPYSILTFNKGIKQGKDLKTDTILVIPLNASSAEPTKSEISSSTTKEVEEQETPIGFTSHKAKKRETLYGIAKRYHITEDDIKRYNRELYSSQLRKKMVLRIPKYKGASPTSVNEDDLETYVVAAKETRWSIAHKYGITIESMVALNPELSKNSNYLAEGQELKMPKKAGASVQNQVTELFISYTVPAKMNFYRLEKKFGAKSDEIVRLNPEISERGGLKEGMVIRIPERKIDAGDVNTDNYIFYEVKPKQTEFSLPRKLGISYKDLLALNPDLKNGLKAGMILKLPKDQTGDFEVRNALVLDKIDLLDSINTVNRPKLMFLLPFRFNKLDMANKKSVIKNIETRNSLKYSLGLYSGALVAIDSIASLGISVDVVTFDNQLDLAKTKEILLREDLNGLSAIIGPFDVPSLREVAVRASSYNVPVIAPIPVKADMSMGNVFFSYPADGVLRNRMLNYVHGKITDQNIVVIADEENTVVKDSILARFPKARYIAIKKEKKTIGIDINELTKQLSEKTGNWVFVETRNYKLVSSVSSILNSKITKDIKIRMFTTNKNGAFENDVISGAHLSNLNFTYPSVHREAKNSGFAKRYRKRFGDTPDRYAVRGFDITYDLLLKLAYKNDLIDVSKLIGETEYTGNKFSYEKDFTSGFYNQASYIMTYREMRIEEIKE